MNREVDILPTYSEDGSAWVLTITGLNGHPLTKSDVADCLRGYADFLEQSEDDLAN